MGTVHLLQCKNVEFYIEIDTRLARTQVSAVGTQSPRHPKVRARGRHNNPPRFLEKSIMEKLCEKQERFLFRKIPFEI